MGINNSLINTSTNGQNSFLGHEADVVFNMNIGEILGLGQSGLKDVKMRTTLGLFRSGDAYGPYKGEYSMRGFSELVLHF